MPSAGQETEGTEGTQEASTAEREIREEFRRWFDEAAAKDLDGVMSHVAPDVVSYEHDAPLQYVGAGGVRAVCRRGFDAMPGPFRWDVPEMTVLVRGDLAVQWGLNRMTGASPDGTPFEGWSRGTRVFQKTEGRWLMIHQHVSYPYDPATGEAKTDLTP